MDEISPGIHRWTAPHPEWRTRDPWGHQVTCYALRSERGLTLIDPLLPPDGAVERTTVEARLDALAAAAPRLDILVTIPYHTRSAEALWLRYHAVLPARIWGAPPVVKRFVDPATPRQPLHPGADAGPDAVALGIGKPLRSERPLYLAAFRALAFGDALVSYRGALRIWQPPPFSERWYRGAFLPSLQPLLGLDVERVLVTHGEPVLRAGRAALLAALEAPPWRGPER